MYYCFENNQASFTSRSTNSLLQCYDKTNHDIGSCVWVSTSVDNLNTVFRLQKCAPRVILNADTRANSVDLFRELNWLPFFYEAKINQCALVYKRLNGVCPDYMPELLK